jgi:transcriptional regulator with XRE-family HTH domain
MVRTREEHTFNEELRRRTRELREGRELQQQQIADLLGVDVETYKKYETRTPLPRYLIPRFARLVGASISFLMTGYEEK